MQADHVQNFKRRQRKVAFLRAAEERNDGNGSTGCAATDNGSGMVETTHKANVVTVTSYHHGDGSVLA